METSVKTNFSVPTRTEVSANNQAIFDNLQKGLGFVPNLYAYIGKNETALGDYLTLQNRKSTLKAKEREVINLVTSQINGCRYCQSAHTVLGKMNGFTDEQLLDIRNGKAEVQVWLTEKSEANLAKLKELGFEVILDAKSPRLIVGRFDRKA